MLHRVTAWVWSAGFVAGLALVHCSSASSSSTTCIPDFTKACTCAGGAIGEQGCKLDGSGFNECSCAPSTTASSTSASSSRHSSSSSSSGSSTLMISSSSASLDAGGDATDATDACTPETDAQLCMAANANCGVLAVTDNCGAQRSPMCGTCVASGVTCGGGKLPNVCGSTVSPSARSGASMAYDSVRGVTVMFGGCPSTNCNSGPYFNDVWEWNGAYWTQGTPMGSPVARSGASMTYDSVRQVTLMFGGGINSNITDYNDLWSWNGTTWINLVPNGSPTAPPVRNSAGLVFDSNRGVSVLFAGNIRGDSMLDDTWEWNGSAWRNATPSGLGGGGTNPTSRMQFAAAFDTVTNTMIIYGGCGASGCSGLLGDMWSWNGAAWTSLTVTPPDPGPLAATYMAFDTATSQAILYLDNPSSPSTWALSSSVPGQMQWSNLSPPATPPYRFGAPVVYDSMRKVVVMFGGAGSTGPLNDVWEWNGTTWNDVTP